MKEKFIAYLLFSIVFFIFNACTPSKVTKSKGGFYHSDIYFGKNFSSPYKKGIKDGCTTAKGSYRKSHTLFNKNGDYNNGWFLGRKRCRHLLVIEKNKEDK